MTSQIEAAAIRDEIQQLETAATVPAGDFVRIQALAECMYALAYHVDTEAGPVWDKLFNSGPASATGDDGGQRYRRESVVGFEGGIRIAVLGAFREWLRHLRPTQGPVAPREWLLFDALFQACIGLLKEGKDAAESRKKKRVIATLPRRSSARLDAFLDENLRATRRENRSAARLWEQLHRDKELRDRLALESKGAKPEQGESDTRKLGFRRGREAKVSEWFGFRAFQGRYSRAASRSGKRS